MSGPSLFREVTSRDIGSQDDLRTSFSEIEWRGPRRFVLREHRLILASDAGFARASALTETNRQADDRPLFFAFSPKPIAC